MKQASLETVRWLPISYGDRLSNTAIRGVYPDYGEIRNEVASEGRWISGEDFLERRRVVFLGEQLRKQLFGGRPAVGETVLISGVRFTGRGRDGREAAVQQLLHERRRVRLHPVHGRGATSGTRATRACWSSRP